jgi:prepilin-type N-terminal cleavage/methylation domain-containing protein
MNADRALILHHSSLSGARSHFQSGFTLIEMAVVVALMSVLMVLATTTLTTLFRVQRQIASDAAQDLAIARLARHWRADAHEAVEANTDTGCSFVLIDRRTIAYTLSPPAIIREVRHGPSIKHRDAFVLPRQADVRFVGKPVAGGRIMCAAIAPAETASRAYAVPVRAIQIEAAVNLRRQAADKEGPP